MSPELTPQERRLRIVLGLMALVFAGFIVAYLVDGLNGGGKFPFVANAVTKDGLFLAITLIAIGNVRRFGWLTLVVILGHLMLIASLGLMLATGNTSGADLLPGGSGEHGVRTLLIWGAADVLVVAALSYLYWRARPRPPELSVTTNDHLTAHEWFLRIGLGILAVVFAGFMVAYLVDGVNGGGRFPFVANSVTKDGLFLSITLIAIANLRRFGWLTVLVILGHLMLIASLGLMLATGNTSGADLLPGGSEEHGVRTLLIWGALDILVVIVLGILYWRAQGARYGLKYLWPHEFETLEALSDVLIDDEGRRIEPRRIAGNVESYLSRFKARGKWKVRLAIEFLTFSPLLSVPPHLPLPMMERTARLRFVRGYFVPESANGSANGTGSSAGRGPWRAFVQRMIGVGAQLSYFGYYGDRDTFASIGYQRYSDRDRAVTPLPDVGRRRLQAEPVNGRTMTADIVIVGSGAAGAILAYELAARGKDVIVLERGKLVDRSEFNDNEPRMLSLLYRDGALGVSRDLRFAVLQGMCVGGSTVVNNAVCIPAPEEVLDRWNDPTGLNAGLDLESLDNSFEHVHHWLQMNAQSATHFSHGAEKLLEGAAALDIEAKVVEANIVGCRGCGYCNIGCKYGEKLSMLDKVLPEAQEKLERPVRIVPDCQAKRIVMNGVLAEGVRCKLEGDRALLVRANESVIVSAGAINSSRLLQRSGVASDLPVGRNLSFNMATPLTAHFDEQLRSYDGLQISHYLSSPEIPECVMETWFNPPAMQSMFMPGWFDQHTANMAEYSRMACAGVVVGTGPNGNVRWGIGTDFDFKPSVEDMERLVEGLKLVGRMYLKAGADRVMPATFHYHTLTEENLDELDRYKTDRSGMSLNSAHPQGGNAISVHADRGVVDPSFRVHGIPNLYVCDASVFPSSITVNPQFTVMALAHYAASKIGGDLPPPAVEPAAPREPRFPRRAPEVPEPAEAPERSG
jgi:choline dehydrogenase-like flavoprotein